MLIHLINKPFNYIVIDDFYTNDELSAIMQEVVELEKNSLEPQLTKTAFIEETNELLKSGKGLFLYEHFKNDLTKSKILNLSQKIFWQELTKIFINFDASFSHLTNATFQDVLLNFYKNNDKYLPHKDTSTISAITFLKVGEFEGGNFLFSDYNEVVEFKHNRIVIFHGCIKHEAQEIKASNDSYRASIAHFIGYKN